jgi:hypothetical protein
MSMADHRCARAGCGQPDIYQYSLISAHEFDGGKTIVRVFHLLLLCPYAAPTLVNMHNNTVRAAAILNMGWLML